MTLVECPSPNFDDRGDQAVDMLVLHYTGMKSADDARDKLCNARNEKKVSAHYLIDEDGTAYRLVAEEKRAWHAGISFWRGNTNINQRSVGIEIVNPGHEYGYRPFPPAQMQTVAEICREIVARHRIPARNVVGHSDIAPSRKEDPGELFDWRWLAEQGIGLWPTAKSTNSLPPGALVDYGYDVSDQPKAITAFQRHFRPKNLTGQWDDECALLLARLLEAV